VPRQSIAAHGLSPLYAKQPQYRQPRVSCLATAGCRSCMKQIGIDATVARDRIQYCIYPIHWIHLTMNVATAGLGLAAIRWKR
jgi:hypothetical protein